MDELERLGKPRELRTLPHTGSKVVSVRVSQRQVDRLEALSARTGRSKGFYIRAALQEMLPVLMERYWSHAIEDEHERELYIELMQMLDEPTDRDGA